MLLILSSIVTMLRTTLRSRRDLALENMALRQQLAILRHKEPRPRLQGIRPSLLDAASSPVAEVARCADCRPARNIDPLASTGLPEVLAMEVSLHASRPAASRR